MKPMNRTFAMAAVLSLAMIVTPALFAQQQKNYDQNGEAAVVIAHLPLNGPAVTRMFTQTHNYKRYLYVDQGGANGVTVIDVSRPSHPVVVQQSSWPNNAAAGDVQFVGSNLAVSQQPAETITPTPRTVNILDVVNAGQPAVLKTFAGVTSVLTDTPRNLLYLANADGLWVVRHRTSQAGYAARHMCMSEDVLNPIPDCY